MVVNRKNIGSFNWAVSGSNLVLPGLCGYPSKFFALDPSTINILSGTKASTFTPSQLVSNFQFSTSSDVTVLAADYADANWTSLGWTPNDDTTFFAELQTFIVNNYNNQTISPNLSDMVLCISRGNIGGTVYSIPFFFFGNIGDIIVDSNTLALFRFDGDYADASSFNHSLTVNGSPSFVTGKYGSAVHLDNNLSMDGGLTEWNFGSNNFTIEFWWKPEVLGGTWAGYDAGGPRRVFSKEGGAPFAFQYRMTTLSPGQTAGNAVGSITGITSSNPFMAVEFVNFGSTSTNGTDGTFAMFGFDTVGIDTSNFHHFAVVRNGSSLIGYFNGVASNLVSVSVSGGGTWDARDSGRPWKIGTDGFIGGSSFGTWDNVRISNVARYTTNFTPGPY